MADKKQDPPSYGTVMAIDESHLETRAIIVRLHKHKITSASPRPGLALVRAEPFKIGRKLLLISPSTTQQEVESTCKQAMIAQGLHTPDTEPSFDQANCFVGLYVKENIESQCGGAAVRDQDEWVAARYLLLTRESAGLCFMMASQKGWDWEAERKKQEDAERWPPCVVQ